MPLNKKVSAFNKLNIETAKVAVIAVTLRMSMSDK